MSQGNEDWQRTSNYDGPVLFSQGGEEKTGSIELLNTLFVGRYAYLAGIANTEVNAYELRLRWFADEAATILVGERNIIIDVTIASNAQIRILNLGPWVRVSFIVAPGKKYKPSVVLLPSNRIAPTECIPQQSTLIPPTLITLPKGAEKNVNPVSYFSGPVRFLFISKAVAGLIVVQVSTSPGVYEEICNIPLPAKGILEPTIITPLGAWRVAVENTSAEEGSYVVAGIWSPTGSS